MKQYFNKLQGTLKSFVGTPKFIYVIIAMLVFLAVAVFTYSRYIAPKIEANYVDNREFSIEGGAEGVEGDKEVTVYYFFTTWCPYCKKARPEWDASVDSYNGKSINGHKIKMIAIDAEKDPDLADKFSVDGYPSVKMVKNGKVIEYDAKLTKSTFSQFLKSTLN